MCVLEKEALAKRKAGQKRKRREGPSQGLGDTSFMDTKEGDNRNLVGSKEEEGTPFPQKATKDRPVTTTPSVVKGGETKMGDVTLF